MSLLYRNQSIDLESKSMGWFLYDRDLCHERVNFFRACSVIIFIQLARFNYILSFSEAYVCLIRTPYSSLYFLMRNPYSIAILSLEFGIPISSFSLSVSEIHFQEKLSEANLPFIPPNIIIS